MDSICGEKVMTGLTRARPLWKCDLEIKSAAKERFRFKVRNPENDPLENDLVETILLPALLLRRALASMATSQAKT
jgi:hypothetical protein